MSGTLVWYITRYVWYVTQSLKTSLDNAIAKAKAHLEAQMDGIDPYALAIVTHALTVSKSSKAEEALGKLNDLAIKSGMFRRLNSYMLLKHSYRMKMKKTSCLVTFKRLLKTHLFRAMYEM